MRVAILIACLLLIAVSVKADFNNVFFPPSPPGTAQQDLLGRINPLAHGAFFDGQGYAAGTTTASSTTFSDTTNHPFLPTDCHSGAGCTGATDKLIIVYEAANYPDWPGAAQSCPHGTCIQPTTNNAGNFLYCAKNWSTGTTGGSAPAFSQSSANVLTTDNTCTWETSFNVFGVLDTGAPLVTTITGYTSASQVTLANQANWSINGAATYVYGHDDKQGMQTSINLAAAITPNGGGAVILPCGNGTAGSTGTGMLSGELTMSGQGVEIIGCGWGTLEGSTGPLGQGLIWAARTAGVPMIRVNNAYLANIHGIRFKGNSSFPPSSIIEFCDNGTSHDGFVCNDSPPNRMDVVENVYVGDRGPFSSEHDEFAQYTTGIQLVGTANDQPITLSNDHFNGFILGAVDAPVNQSVANVYDNLYALSTGGLANWAYRVGGNAVFDGVTGLGLTSENSNVGGTVFDLLSGADIIARGLVSEATGRMVVCDMNGLSSMQATIRILGKYFQTWSTQTATDGKLIDCGMTSPGGAVAGQIQIALERLSMTDHAGQAFGLGWTFDVQSTGTNTTAKLDIISNQLGPVSWNNLFASTGGNGSIAQISLNGVDATYGLRDLTSFATGPFGTTSYFKEFPNTLKADAGALFGRINEPVVGSPCTVHAAGAATCRYFVTALDSNGGQTLPGGISACTSSAALGSQNNTIQVYIDPGAQSYRLWGDNCAGGAINNLLSTTTASTIGLYTVVANQIALSDNGIARTGGTVPTVNSTSAIVSPYNITGIQAAPVNPGDVLSAAKSTGEVATYSALPTYSQQVLATTPAVYLRMDDASGNFTDTSGNSNTCVSSVAGISYQQTGAIVDDPDTAATFASASSGQCTVATSASMPAGDTVSCAGWVKFVNPTLRQEILGQKSGGFDFFLSASATIVGTLQLQEANTQIAGTQPFTINDSAYHYVGFSKNAGTSARIFIDGADRTGVYSNQTLAPADGTLYVAAQTASSNFLNGTLDEIACWPVALTATQQANLYQEGLTKKYGAIMYDLADGCFFKYIGGTWNSGECGIRTVGAGTAQQPACSASLKGAQETVTDSNTVVWGATLTSGGANTVGGYCDATNWTVFGK